MMSARTSQPVRAKDPSPRRVRAFTLMELVVSIGVLALMLTITGAVFKVTMDSAGQAQALMEVSQSLRVLEHQLREDLRSVARGGSILVIDSRYINAFWTEQDREANAPGTSPYGGGTYPLAGTYFHESDPEREDENGDKVLPRADVLMLFTQRQARSCNCPGVIGEVQQVVYGHAEIGELDSSGNWAGAGTPTALTGHPDPPVTGTIFPTPAERWHLARRSTLIVDGVVTGCTQQQPDLDDGGGAADPNPIYESQADIVALSGGAGDFVFTADVVNRTRLGLADGLEREEFEQWYGRSRLDLAPPAKYADRTGHYFMPNVASFKVEWGWDLGRRYDPASAGASLPGELAWVDPQRPPRNLPGGQRVFQGIEDLAQQYAADIDPQIKALAEAMRADADMLQRRFSTKDFGVELVTRPVWFADDAINETSAAPRGVPDRFFPDALRITVDMFDRTGRLERPIRHVMVLPIGR